MISRRLIWMGLETFEVLNQKSENDRQFLWILDGYKNVKKFSDIFGHRYVGWDVCSPTAPVPS